MAEPLCKVDWYCTHCGGSGTATMWADLCAQGQVAELVRAHSLTCPGCDGDARKTLRYRRPSDSDSDWQQAKDSATRRVAERRAAHLCGEA